MRPRKRLLVPGAALFAVCAGGLTVVALDDDKAGHEACIVSSTPKPRPPYRQSVTDWVPWHPSLQAAVEHYDLVVVGRIVDLVGMDDRYPPGFDRSQVLSGKPNQNITSTKFLVLVDEYLAGSGPDELTMRIPRNLIQTHGSEDFPRPIFGQEMILFLTKDFGRNDNWLSNNPWSQLIWEDCKVRFVYRGFNGDPTEALPVPWFKGRTWDEAKEDIRDMGVQVGKPAAP